MLCIGGSTRLLIDILARETSTSVELGPGRPLPRRL